MNWFLNHKRKKRCAKEPRPLPVLREATIPIYTRDAWFKCFPDSTESAWRKRGYEDAVNSAVMQNLEYMQKYEICDIGRLEEIRFVALDEEYFDWLERKQKRDSANLRAAYIHEINDIDAGRLWEKNRMGYVYTGCALVYTLLGGIPDRGAATHFLLTKEQQTRIRQLLEQIFGEGTVWVSRQFIDSSAYVREERVFCEEGRVWLKEGRGFSRAVYNEQYYEGNRVNVLNFCIPVVVSCRYGFRISPRKMFTDFTNIHAFPDHCGMARREEMKKIGEILDEAVNHPAAFVNPLLIRPANIPDFLIKQAEMIQSSLERLRRKK